MINGIARKRPQRHDGSPGNPGRRGGYHLGCHLPGWPTVELITIASAGRQWPGAAPGRLAQKLRHTARACTALNAPQVIWRFFARAPRARG